MTQTHKTAIVFPGQGSQSVGMLLDIASHFSEITNTFAQASEVLGFDLWELVKNGPAEKLDQTINTQPALLAASYALWRVLKKYSHKDANMLAGHSLGEYTALVCANALTFQDAIKLVAARGKFMQEAVPAGMGAMAAIVGLDNDRVAALCKEVVMQSEDILSPANYNSIGQVVIAGHKHLVEQAMKRAKEEGAKLVILLPVSVPSHCALMKSAAERLKSLLQNIQLHKPEIPVINNVDVIPYQDIDSIRTGLINQLSSPVCWVETIQYFIKSGITEIIECGPGKILTGLNKRIDKQLQLATTEDLNHLQLLIKHD